MFLKKLKIELAYDPGIALLGIYTKDTDVVKRRAICPQKPNWKELRCPPTDEWIEKILFISTMGYGTAIRKEEYLPLTSTGMEQEGVTPSEVSQAEKDNYHMLSLICRT